MPKYRDGSGHSSGWWSLETATTNPPAVTAKKNPAAICHARDVFMDDVPVVTDPGSEDGLVLPVPEIVITIFTLPEGNSEVRNGPQEL